MKRAIKKRTILHHYLHAALWCEGLDDKDIEDILPASITNARKDIKLFVDTNKKLLEQSGLSDEQIGHDFWLTRNGHGAGFWDREIGKVGDKLTNACKKFTTINLFNEAQVIIE